MKLHNEQNKKNLYNPGSNAPAWIYRCGGAIISIDSSANCELIATGSVDKKLSLISKQGRLIWEKQLDEEVWAVAFADIARFVVAGTAKKNPPSGSIYIFKSTGHQLCKFEIGSPVWSVSTSDDAKVIVASAWNNQAYRFEYTGKKFEQTGKGSFGKYGLYGIETSRKGDTTILAASDHGITILNEDFVPNNGGKIKLKNGLYNIAIGHDGRKIVAGCRDGKFYYIDNLKNKIGKYSTRLSDRPICGVAITEDGLLVASGAFDGKLYVTTNKGRCLWDYQTSGEVWSTSVSKDGTHVLAGSGDHCLYFFNNNCNTSVVKELEDLELYLDFIQDRRRLKKELVKALEVYRNHGLIQYGLSRSREMLQEKIHNADYEKIIFDFLANSLDKNPNDYRLHRLLAIQAEKMEKHDVAVHHNQVAANDSELYFSSMVSSGVNFLKLGLASAARSCFRRAIAQSLDYSTHFPHIGSRIILNFQYRTYML